MHTCIHAYRREFKHIHTYMYAYMHTYVCTDHAFIYTCMHACIPTGIHTDHTEHTYTQKKLDTHVQRDVNKDIGTWTYTGTQPYTSMRRSLQLWLWYFMAHGRMTRFQARIEWVEWRKKPSIFSCSDLDSWTQLRPCVLSFFSLLRINHGHEISERC